MPSNPKSSAFQPLSVPILSRDDDDDDFQIPLSQSQISLSIVSASKQPLKPSSNRNQPRKRTKRSANRGKENVDPNCLSQNQKTASFDCDKGLKLYGDRSLDLVESSCFSQNQKKMASFDCGDEGLKLYENCSLDFVESSCLSQDEKKTMPFDCNDEGLHFHENCSLDLIESSIDGSYRNVKDVDFVKEEGLEVKKKGYSSNSIEARLIRPKFDEIKNSEEEDNELDLLIKLRNDEMSQENNGDCLVQCPICGIDISNLNEESKLVHTNDCLDKEEKYGQGVVTSNNEKDTHFPPQIVDDDRVHSRDKVIDVSPVIKWLRNLGMERYEEAFVREEIDWDSLKWLTEEDLFSIGVTALGPRKKIVYVLAELRKGCNQVAEAQHNSKASADVGSRSTRGAEVEASDVVDETSKQSANKLITDYFPGSVTFMKKTCSNTMEKQEPAKNRPKSLHKRALASHHVKSGKPKDIPLWCIIPGTPFRVDAFKYLRGDCSHWFLTHFHMDHYQGLTRSFCHGKIYCSLITAKLVNMKIGIPWDRLQVLPLNQKINISGVDITCLDANHCPGSIILLFEPPNGKAVLHTGDFRFCDNMASIPALQMCRIHTLILDTTYCNPQVIPYLSGCKKGLHHLSFHFYTTEKHQLAFQVFAIKRVSCLRFILFNNFLQYDFPKQEAVIQFVIEAIQAESFNPKTLFLVGSYTIGKERLFLEAARVLHRKIYVTAAKFRLLESLGFSEEDMQWFTLNEQDSQIHVVPMWTLASFKRLKHLSKQYEGRFSLIVAFSPTGWTFGKGKKKSPGRRWQQGTIIRYEVPYSEHCCFTELREFVKFISPERIIPSVNNDGPESVDTMVSLLLS